MPDWHKVRRCGLEMFAVETYGGRREEKRREGLNQLGTVKPCGSADGKGSMEKFAAPRRGIPFLGCSFRHTPTGS